MDETRLTLYSHGSGCGCKIDPAQLDRIIGGSGSNSSFPQLLVGHDEQDDAAVLDLEDGTALISTTDFFMPIVDDPYDFGRIAATNALSDVYAMGGRPVLAVAILGWPVGQLPEAMASRVLKGARDVCNQAVVPVGGGHSIDSLEPFFGLAVNGRVAISDLKRNQGARPGDVLVLTKPLGVGLYTSAAKLERLRPGDMAKALDVMTRLNDIGMKIAHSPQVHAMTDITGFGLFGHLLEMCRASDVGAILDCEHVPLIDHEALDHYLRMQCAPAATARNWHSYEDDIGPVDDRFRQLFSDPQTSGGLLVAMAPDFLAEFQVLNGDSPFGTHVIGRITDRGPDRIVETSR